MPKVDIRTIENGLVLKTEEGKEIYRETLEDILFVAAVYLTNKEKLLDEDQQKFEIDPTEIEQIEKAWKKKVSNRPESDTSDIPPFQDIGDVIHNVSNICFLCGNALRAGKYQEVEIAGKLVRVHGVCDKERKRKERGVCVLCGEVIKQNTWATVEVDGIGPGKAHKTCARNMKPERGYRKVNEHGNYRCRGD